MHTHVSRLGDSATMDALDGSAPRITLCGEFRECLIIYGTLSELVRDEHLQRSARAVLVDFYRAMKLLTPCHVSARGVKVFIVYSGDRARMYVYVRHFEHTSGSDVISILKLMEILSSLALPHPSRLENVWIELLDDRRECLVLAVELPPLEDNAFRGLITSYLASLTAEKIPVFLDQRVG